MVKTVEAFTPYFTEAEADQVRAAFLAAGGAEGYVSVSDLIVGGIAATLFTGVSPSAFSLRERP